MMNRDEAFKASKHLYEVWRKLLPDSRLMPQNRRVVDGPIGKMVDTFCCNCGRHYGMVTADGFITDILVLCNECYWKYGDLPAQKVPKEIEDALMYRKEE